MPSVVPPAFPFYAFDWLSSSTRAMSLAARGAYVDLLAFAWDQHGLPADTEALRRMTGASPDEWALVWPELATKFPIAADGRRRNAKLEEVRGGVKAASARGVRGGRARASAATRAPGGLFAPASEPASSQPANQRPTSVTTSVQPASRPASHQPRARAEVQDLKIKIKNQDQTQDQDPGLAAGTPICGNVENSQTPDTCPPDTRTPVRLTPSPRQRHRDDGPPKPRQIARVAADVLQRDPTLTLADLTEDTKRACARMGLPYDSGAVRQGIDALFHQQRRSRDGGWTQLSACTG